MTDEDLSAFEPTPEELAELERLEKEIEGDPPDWFDEAVERAKRIPLTEREQAN